MPFSMIHAYCIMDTGDMGMMTSSTTGERIGDCTGKEPDSE